MIPLTLTIATSLHIRFKGSESSIPLSADALDLADGGLSFFFDSIGGRTDLLARFGVSTCEISLLAPQPIMLSNVLSCLQQR
jgi:hypothetical protein